MQLNYFVEEYERLHTIVVVRETPVSHQSL